MMLNYKYEIHPTEEQINTLNGWLSLCRQTYNSALLDRKRRYEKYKRNLPRTEMQKIQTRDKKKFPFLKEVPSQPLQEVFFRLDRAYKKFFEGNARYPKIKKHRDYNSLTFTQFGIASRKVKNKKTGKTDIRPVRYAASFDDEGKLLISKLGAIEINKHRKLGGTVKQVIIKRQGSRWFAIFCVERHVNRVTEVDMNKTTGIDVGIKKFAVLSSGKEFENPKFLQKKEKQLKREQRRLSRKVKSSSNWKKQLDKVQKLHTKVSNQRRDFHHKLSYRISNEYGIVCVEDLKISNMVKNRHLSKSIHDAGWGSLRNMIEYKSERNGGKLVKVKPHYTSQKCSTCGELVKKSLSVRTHVCENCGTILDRDHNAAINIEKVGLQQIGYEPTA